MNWNLFLIFSGALFFAYGVSVGSGVLVLNALIVWYFVEI